MKKIFLLGLIFINSKSSVESSFTDQYGAVSLTVALAAAGYFGYKTYEDHAIKNCYKRLEQNKKVINDLSFNYSHELMFNPEIKDQYLLNKFKKNQLDYLNYISGFDKTVETIKKIQHQTIKDRNSWQNSQKATFFVIEASNFKRDNQKQIESLQKILSYLKERKYLISASISLDETNTKYQDLINKIKRKKELTESDIRFYSPDSTYPLRQTYKDLELEKSKLETLKNMLSAFNTKTTISQENNLYLGNIIDIYRQSLQMISSFKDYTNDLKVEKELKLKEEEISLQKQKVELERQAVDTQRRKIEGLEKQARALEERNIQDKKRELYQLETELNAIKSRIRSGEMGLLEREKSLKRRIKTLKIDIYGGWGLLSVILDN